MITTGYMQVGWMDVCESPGKELGIDEHSYAFDGFSVSDLSWPCLVVVWMLCLHSEKWEQLA